FPASPALEGLLRPLAEAEVVEAEEPGVRADDAVGGEHLVLAPLAERGRELAAGDVLPALAARRVEDERLRSLQRERAEQPAVLVVGMGRDVEHAQAVLDAPAQVVVERRLGGRLALERLLVLRPRRRGEGEQGEHGGRGGRWHGKGPQRWKRSSAMRQRSSVAAAASSQVKRAARRMRRVRAASSLAPASTRAQAAANADGSPTAATSS